MKRGSVTGHYFLLANLANFFERMTISFRGSLDLRKQLALDSEGVRLYETVFEFRRIQSKLVIL